MESLLTLFVTPRVCHVEQEKCHASLSGWRAFTTTLHTLHTNHVPARQAPGPTYRTGITMYKLNRLFTLITVAAGVGSAQQYVFVDLGISTAPYAAESLNSGAPGLQVGIANIPNTPSSPNGHAYLWNGTSAGYQASSANGTNGFQEVGYAVDGAGSMHAVVWSGTAASAVDLNQFLPAGFVSASARAIDANGNIVGSAATPIPGSTLTTPHPVMWIRVQ